MKTVFTARAAEDYRYWQDNDPKKFERVRQLIKALHADAFVGIGKPEPLKHKRPLWSRRIDREHRLVYYVKDGEIVIISCRFHYTGI
ncbi:Txe/YoeB family addiction module toxin [Rahnella bruchi]|uniref:Txe/YoeB family addiction module toxin n=1 Tax=Rahnella bruchi TaxID=1510573 RepID=UPI000EA294FA|nr:Txe/YoeB family addiction module toxin [Rahnella bruchi]